MTRRMHLPRRRVLAVIPNSELAAATRRGKYWVGSRPQCDICHEAIKDQFVDGVTTLGPWAVMCPGCYGWSGVGVGIGLGQQYQLHEGRYLKVRG